jgi:hypothetical protein
MLVTHDAHPLASFVPVEQYACEQEVVPLHVDWPHTDATSPTHWLLHDVVQQYESVVQICAAHGSQLELSLPPFVHRLCAHVPPPIVHATLVASVSVPRVPVIETLYVPAVATPGDSVSAED